LEVKIMRYRVLQLSALMLAILLCLSQRTIAAEIGARAIHTVPGMPPVIDPNNLYSETRSGNLSPVVANH
jgi:hypothetical protein